uniref:Phospholamban n=1 Tax=Sinocyclocheilus rhinocerous TaxID=307959 RepID=A0A673MKC2_9TELE
SPAPEGFWPAESHPPSPQQPALLPPHAALHSTSRYCRPSSSLLRTNPSHPPLLDMEKVQHITRAAIRRASTMEIPQQAKQNMQELFINFCLILICLLLIYIIVLLM